jgi:hypothetical protein
MCLLLNCIGFQVIHHQVHVVLEMQIGRCYRSSQHNIPLMRLRILTLDGEGRRDSKRKTPPRNWRSDRDYPCVLPPSPSRLSPRIHPGGVPHQLVIIWTSRARHITLEITLNKPVREVIFARDNTVALSQALTRKIYQICQLDQWKKVILKSCKFSTPTRGLPQALTHQYKILWTMRVTYILVMNIVICQLHIYWLCILFSTQFILITLFWTIQPRIAELTPDG